MRGMTLAGARKKMKENKDDMHDDFEIIQTLNQVKEMLIEIRDEM
jgi:hypothetical protein